MKIANATFWRSMLRGTRGAIIHSMFSSAKMGKGHLVHRAGFGTMYDLFLNAHSKKPNRQTYNLLQAFKNYVMLIDPVIDSRKFRARTGKKFGTIDLRAIPESKRGVNSFVELLKKSNLSMEQKKQLIKIFGNFRRSAVIGIERTMQNPFANKGEVFRGIEQTAGLFLGTASDIASVCYGISKEQAQLSRKAFENFTNALQIRDDMRDALVDFGICQNSIVSIALNVPEEFNRLKEAAGAQKGKKLSKKWIKKNLPKTMAEATMCFEQYVAKIPKTKTTHEIERACRDAFYGL